MREKTPNVFLAEMRELHPDIEVMGEYVRSKIGVDCRCRFCGHEWTTSGQSLVQGSGCPACARKKNSDRQRGIPVKRRI